MGPPVPPPSANGLLDDANKAIVEELQKDGRRTYGAIAEAVGLSEAAVRQRVQKMRDAGIMQIVAVTDPMQVGFHSQAMVGIRTDGDSRMVAKRLADVDNIDYVVMCTGSFDILVELVCEDEDALLELLNGVVRRIPGVRETETFMYLKLTKQTYTWGDPMTERSDDALQESARRHLWMHFTRMSRTQPVPVIVRGEGVWVYDQFGKRYLDGLSGLFTSQIGHGRTELAEAAARQAQTLAYFPVWSYVHPMAVELADRLAELTPGDCNRIFFTSGGSEAVESAWKLARQYFEVTGQPERYKVISRNIAYHGATMGALSITGVTEIRKPFEPLVPGAIKVPNTNFYRAPYFADDLEAFGRWAADAIEQAIVFEGPDTVAAVFLEPVQNAGGCFPPPPGYFRRVREICDRYGVLLVSDEVICAFGRLGHWFGAERYDYQPDIITMAKGLTSGYSPMGAMAVSDRLVEPFLDGESFLHGVTFGGHPVSAAVALANIEVFEKEGLLERVRHNEAAFAASLDTLRDLPIVGDVRGAGYFYGIELVKDKVTRETFDDDEAERLLRGFLSGALYDAGLICRADDRGDPVVQLAPPLICGEEEFEVMTSILRSVLTEAWKQI